MAIARFTLVLRAVLVALGAHIPLVAEVPGWATTVVDDPRWRFDISLSETNTTSNLIFDTVASLLQQWGNTHYRNGHNIVPATIPAGTVLYHGTSHHAIPSAPDWAATDPEHSFAFCRRHEGDLCWQLVLAVQRPLNVLYFDGASAVKMYGPLDAQDFIAFGSSRDTIGRTFDEWTRITNLCEWGRNYTLDGFIRMEMNFEVMLCDFKNSLMPISFEPIVPGLPPLPGPPNPWPSMPLYLYPQYRMAEAGQWHYHFPGETRMILDLTRLISFYDTDMFPELASTRLGLERYDHRIQKLEQAGKQRLMERLDELLTTKPGESGIDWTSTYRVVIHRYGDRLEVVQYMLNQTQLRQDPRQTKTVTTSDVFKYVESMIAPYILHGVRPQPNNNNLQTPSFLWASPVFTKCATTLTKFSATLELTYSERILLQAVNDVLREICRVVVGFWAEGVEFEQSRQSGGGDSQVFRFLAEKWAKEVNALMAWLDWSVWVKCRPACSFEEICYLPTWPFFHRDGLFPSPEDLIDSEFENHPARGFVRGRHSGWVAGTEEAEDRSYWMRPQPRCLRRVPPLQFPL